MFKKRVAHANTVDLKTESEAIDGPSVIENPIEILPKSNQSKKINKFASQIQNSAPVSAVK